MTQEQSEEELIYYLGVGIVIGLGGDLGYLVGAWLIPKVAELPSLLQVASNPNSNSNIRFFLGATNLGFGLIAGLTSAIFGAVPFLAGLLAGLATSLSTYLGIGVIVAILTTLTGVCLGARLTISWRATFAICLGVLPAVAFGIGITSLI